MAPGADEAVPDYAIHIVVVPADRHAVRAGSSIGDLRAAVVAAFEGCGVGVDLTEAWSESPGPPPRGRGFYWWVTARDKEAAAARSEEWARVNGWLSGRALDALRKGA
jgi:hypothetical protein